MKRRSALALRNPLGNGLPATYVAVTPHYAPTEASRRLARRLGWDCREIEAGHDAMITSPREVVDLLQPL